jgi:Amt family ammonium transporter
MDGAALTTGDLATAINTVWVLMAGFLVFLMQFGFSMLEAGLVRVKNTANAFMKNILDFCISTLGYWVIGFAFMYGVGNWFVGNSYYFLGSLPSQTGGIPSLAYWFFQLAFAGAAATIVAACVAERIRFPAYLIYSFVISAFVYPVVGHWVWGGGWLGQMGMLDFAGDTVVHSVGAWAGLMGTIVLGPRLGKYSRYGVPSVIQGHNLPLAIMGMWVLWFCWFGFNCGSTLSGLQADLIARIAVNTNLAAAAAAVIAMGMSRLATGKSDVGLTANGALGGLVAVTAACAYISPLSAIIIGALAGLIIVYAPAFMDKMRVDDPVGAFPVHLFCGIFGTIAVGLFHETNGLFFGGGWNQLGVQSIGVLAVAAWTVTTMGLVFWAMKKTIGVRISEKEERAGLDISEHGVKSYPESSGI